MIKFITGQSGSGKSSLLMDYISKLSDEGKEICIIVPEQFSYEFDKKLYKRIGAVKFNKLFSLTFTGLSRQIFQIYGDRKGVYADELSKIILMEEALLNLSKTPDGLKAFKRQINYQGFMEQILKLITNFKRAAISPYKFKEKISLFTGKFKKKSDDILNIYIEYERLLKENGLKDNSSDISEAAKIASLNEYFKGKTVFIDEFESFTGDQYDFLKTIALHSDNVYIALRTDNVNAGEFTLFETVNSTYRKITTICRELNIEYSIEVCDNIYRYNSADLKYLSLNILRNKIDNKIKQKSDNVHIFESRDPYIECEYVCATIKRLLFEDKKLRYKDIAIISNRAEEYSGILESTFERYEIPYFISLKKSVSHTSVMVMISTLIEIITENKFNSELIFRLLKCGLTDFSLLEISILEDYCYKYSIDANRWKNKFVSDDKNAVIAEEIRSKVINSLQKLKSNCKNADVQTICKEMYNYVIECGADKKILNLMEDFILDDKDYLASEQKRIWSFFIQILEVLTQTIGNKTIPMKEFRILFRTLLSQITFSVPPQTIDSVTVASAQTARLNSPKIVFVMGVNEGDFPNTIKMHGLFSEEEKQKLSENGMEISRPAIDLISDENLIVYKSLTIASDKLYITYPLSDLSGQAKYPAAIVKSILELFDNGDEILITEEKLSQDYYAVTIQSAFYHFMQWQKQKDTSIMSIKYLLEENTEYRNKIDFIYKQYSYNGNYNINDKSLLEEMKSFTPLRLSPTRLEEYNSCHFKFFCNTILGLTQREKIELNPLHTGNIIHSCFNMILAKRSKNEFVSMKFDDLSESIINIAEDYKHKNMSGDFEITSRFDMNYKKFTQQIIKAATHLQSEMMISDFLPIKFEYGVGYASNSLTLQFENDKSILFNGFIDRIDVCNIDDEKYIRVIDYKSHKKNLDPVYINNGINMQMLLYLFALTEKGMEFSDYKPAGVLYSPLTINPLKIDNKRFDTLNTSHINSSLKLSGILINDYNVLNAMENGTAGKYIPVQFTKELKTEKKSMCIPLESFEKLKQFSYKKMIETAQTMYNGNFEVNPLIYDEYNSCKYCSYINICGNVNQTISRDGKEKNMTEISEILGIIEEEDEK